MKEIKINRLKKVKLSLIYNEQLNNGGKVTHSLTNILNCIRIIKECDF